MKKTYSKYIKPIENFFDKLEDHVRHKLAHYPKFYALVSGVATIVAWVSVWGIVSNVIQIENNINGAQWFMLLTVAAVSIGTLLITGAFINLFGDREVIEKTLEEEEKLIKKEEGLVEEEKIKVSEIGKEIKEIKEELRKINEKLK